MGQKTHTTVHVYITTNVTSATATYMHIINYIQHNSLMNSDNCTASPQRLTPNKIENTSPYSR